MALSTKLENFEINKKENLVKIFIDTKIYPLEIIYSAAYMFLDKNYVILDGDPKKKIIVQLKPKNSKKIDFEELVGDFNNELINYSVYAIQAARTNVIREALIKRAMKTIEESKEETLEEEEEDLWVNDPEGIAEPWTPEKAKDIKVPEEEQK